jgi:hypothetical protein
MSAAAARDHAGHPHGDIDARPSMMSLSQMELPLPLIGWLFTLVSIAALVLGALMIAALLRAGDLERRYLTFSFWNDALLTGIWVLGLAGGIGVLRLQPWGRYVLELFCWALMVLILLSAASRLYTMKNSQSEARPNWIGAVAGVLLILTPVLVICVATIVTLRSDAARAAFTQ